MYMCVYSTLPPSKGTKAIMASAQKEGYSDAFFYLCTFQENDVSGSGTVVIIPQDEYIGGEKRKVAKL